MERMIEHGQEPATIVGELISFDGEFRVVWGMTAWLIFHVFVELCVCVCVFGVQNISPDFVSIKVKRNTLRRFIPEESTF
jgi:hypothetical protein